MSELGTRLREARVNKGYTLNTLQQMTKIQKKYLQAIEEGHYDEVPGTFYVRAFVKQYADMVGLDGDQLLKDYANELEVQNDPSSEASLIEEKEEELPSRLETRHSGEDKNRLEMILSYIPLFILTGIIILIILILFFAIQDLQKEKQKETAQVRPTTSIVESVEPSSSLEIDNESEKEEADEAESNEDTTETTEESTETDKNQIKVGDQLITQKSEEGSEKTYQLEGNLDKYKFGAEAESFVWLGIYEDGAMVVDQTIPAGESFEYQANAGVQEIRLEFGYPEGGAFTVNGKKIEVDPAVPSSVLFLVGSDADEAANSTESLDVEGLSDESSTETTEAVGD
ncbi:helix-turn-helix domain-containing protein [Facklamia sp. DSM 111018]|uniref:Helix-turn-helix domain-containing protein n=1 Tax=Facklamia lactis TaxID=2749967 RepID=A0ABS0LNG1_9LACT|nr:RodZ domain-containing protein [Facklamia lactis]MBG9985502.1 helix-turn-helix domain-containing protein [Facklamia lactis]